MYRAQIETEDGIALSPAQAAPPLDNSSSITTDARSALRRRNQLFATVALGFVTTVVGNIWDHSWFEQHQGVVLGGVFLAGYAGIISENALGLNKAGLALLTAVSLWTIRATMGDSDVVQEQASAALGEVSQIVLFLVAAMTIVEVLDAHGGFDPVTAVVRTRSRSGLLWVVGLVSFFLSAVLDNLTTTVVMLSLLNRLCPDKETRQYLGAVVVIAANAGGAWTVIGDVTTTMLWVDSRISPLATMQSLLLPSLVSLLLPMALITAFAPEVQGSLPALETRSTKRAATDASTTRLVLAAGLGSLLFLPVFKSLTGLPPYMGSMLGVSLLWVLTDAVTFGDESRQDLRVSAALRRIDLEGILFFLGILMAVASLSSAGILHELAVSLDAVLPEESIALMIGLVSAIVDNVPLVAAAMAMYDPAQFPMDATIWQLLAYCAGTGGSLLIIGSAAGVAYMGLEKATFGWYLRKISPWALLGYGAGAGVYFLTQHPMSPALQMAPQLLGSR